MHARDAVLQSKRDRRRHQDAGSATAGHVDVYIYRGFEVPTEASSPQTVTGHENVRPQAQNARLIMV